MRINPRSEQGQAMVEVALGMPLLFLLMLGAVEFGRLAFAAIEISSSAKAAAQYGAQNHATALDRPGMLRAAQNEYFSTGLTLTSPSGTSGYACTCADTGATVSCTDNDITAPACPGSYVEVQITVQTQATFDAGIHVAGVNSITLHGNAIQKVLQ